MATSPRVNAEKRKHPSEDGSEEGEAHSKDDATQPTQKKLAINLKTRAPAPSAPTKPNATSALSNSTEKKNSGHSATALSPKSKGSIKAVFNSDSDSDQAEEMPPECRMRMRNVGRDTPTSAGPNSFRKGKEGFVDGRKIAERRIHEMISKVPDK